MGANIRDSERNGLLNIEAEFRLIIAFVSHQSLLIQTAC